MSPKSNSPPPDAPMKPAHLRWEHGGGQQGQSKPTKARQGETIVLIAQSQNVPDGVLVEFMLRGIYLESKSGPAVFKRQIDRIKAVFHGGAAKAKWLVRLPTGYEEPKILLSANLKKDGTRSGDEVEIPFEENAGCNVVDLQLKTDDGLVKNTAFEIRDGNQVVCEGSTDGDGRLSASLTSEHGLLTLVFQWDCQGYEIELET